jgi:lysophospholipase L1-like esterase
LQQQLNDRGSHQLSVRVYGAGKSGAASDDHISMIAHRLVHLQPDMIILFSGINDLTRSIYNYDYTHYVIPEPNWQQNLRKSKNSPKYSPMRLWATEFQIPRRFYLLSKRLSPSERDVLETITSKSNYREKIRMRKARPVSNLRPKTDSTPYANNLRTIIGIAKVHGIPLIFMTQQTTWGGPPEAKEWHWMVLRDGVNYRDDFMNEAMESFNDETRALAVQYEIPLYDMARSMPKSHDLFYDDVHMTERGAAVAAEELASLILDKDLIQPTRTPPRVR